MVHHMGMGMGMGMDMDMGMVRYMAHSKAVLN
jgi:hypothetical protein